MTLDRNELDWRWIFAVGGLAGLVLACGGGGGATFGENAPGDPQYGGGTFVDDAHVDSTTPLGIGENGTIAVDPDTETVFTVQVRRVDDERSEKRLVARRPGERPRVILNLTRHSDTRVLFPPGAVLVLTEPCVSFDDHCGDELHWFDKETLDPIGSREIAAQYHGTRVSPKRNWFVAADNSESPSSLHLVDMQTGDANIIPTEEAWYEGMWLHDEDVFIMAHFTDLNQDADNSDAFLTIREWFPNERSDSPIPGQAVCFYREGAAKPPGCDSVAIQGLSPIWYWGFSWIGVSDDDRWVAVPARTEEKAVVVLVDRSEGTLRLVEDAFGPVGFTPDNKTMVAFGFEEYDHPDNLIDGTQARSERPHIVLLDLETDERTHLPTGTDRAPTFFVSHDSNDVVVVDLYGGTDFLLIDLDTDEVTTMPGPAVAVEAARQYAAVKLALEHEELARDPVRSQRERSLESHRAFVNPQAGCEGTMCRLQAPTPLTLQEFVSRVGHDELWLIESGQLLRLDLESGLIHEVEIPGRPAHISIQPSRDRLVIDARGEQELRFFDPTTWRIEESVSISLGWNAYDE